MGLTGALANTLSELKVTKYAMNLSKLNILDLIILRSCFIDFKLRFKTLQTNDNYLSFISSQTASTNPLSSYSTAASLAPPGIG